MSAAVDSNPAESQQEKVTEERHEEEEAPNKPAGKVLGKDLFVSYYFHAYHYTLLCKYITINKFVYVLLRTDSEKLLSRLPFLERTLHREQWPSGIKRRSRNHGIARSRVRILRSVLLG